MIISIMLLLIAIAVGVFVFSHVTGALEAQAEQSPAAGTVNDVMNSASNTLGPLFFVLLVVVISALFIASSIRFMGATG